MRTRSNRLVGGFVLAAALASQRVDAAGWGVTRYSSTGVAEPNVQGGTTNKAAMQAVITSPTGEVYTAGANVTSAGTTWAFVQKYTSALVAAPNFQTSGWGVGIAAWQYPTTGTQADSLIVRDIALTSGGQIVALFSVGGILMVTRLNAVVSGTNTVDTAFGTSGFAFPFGPFPVDGGKLRITAAGTIVVLGTVIAPAGIRVARLTAAGAADTTFGASGIATPALTTTATNRDTAQGLAVDASSRIVIVGRSEASNGALTTNIARLTTTGALDTTYDTDGRRAVDVPGITKEEIMGVATDASSSVYVVARRDPSIAVTPQVYVAKTTAAGAMDTTFGSSGFANTTFAGTSSSPFEWFIAVTNDTLPKVVVAGTIPVASGTDFGVARFTSTGTLDTTFGSGGTVLTAFTGVNARAAGIAFDRSSSKVVVSGTLTSQ